MSSNNIDERAGEERALLAHFEGYSAADAKDAENPYPGDSELSMLWLTGLAHGRLYAAAKKLVDEMCAVRSLDTSYDVTEALYYLSNLLGKR